MKKVLLSLSVGLLFVGCTKEIYHHGNPNTLYLKDSSGTVYRAEKWSNSETSFLYELQPIPKEELEALDYEEFYPEDSSPEITPPYTSPLCPHLDEKYPEFRRPLKNLCPDCEKDLCPKGGCPQPAKLLHPCLTDRVL